MIVAGSMEAAAALTSSFDHVVMTAPQELDARLVESADISCVVVTDVPVEDGQLEQVVQTVLDRCPAGVTVVLRLDDQMSEVLVTSDASALAGLMLIGYSEVSGVPCLLLTPGAPDQAPDLSFLQPALDALTWARERAPGEAERSAVLAEARAVKLRAAATDRELATAKQKLRVVRERLVRTRSEKRRLARQLRRLRSNPFGRAAGLVERWRRQGRRALTQSGSARRRAVVAALALLAVTVTVAVASVAAVVTGSGYVGWLLTVVVLLLGALLLGSGRPQRRLAAGVRRLTRSSRAEFEGLRAEQVALAKAQSGLERALAESDKRRAQQAAADRVDDARQAQAVANLFSLLPVNAAVPAMGGWAASADVVLLLVDDLLARRPRLVVECGSGVSTLWLALAIQKYGVDSRVVSLEHDARFGKATVETLRRHGVDHLVEVRDAPLTVALDGHPTPWYSPSAFEDLHDIGLLFVDGPPEATGPLVRYPAVPLLHERFAYDVTVVLDDMIRESERTVARRWAELLPDFRYEHLRLQKGAGVFRRG